MTRILPKYRKDQLSYIYGGKGQDKAQRIAEASLTPNAYHPSSNAELLFSKDESKLFFGLSKPQIIKDTMLTEDEIVNVEVWTYNEPRLYTVQELQLKKDTIQSFKSVVLLKDDFRIVQLGSESFPEVELGDEGNAKFALIKRSEPYDLGKAMGLEEGHVITLL